jgi:RNA recognition motif-containing protein
VNDSGEHKISKLKYESKFDLYGLTRFYLLLINHAATEYEKYVTSERHTGNWFGSLLRSRVQKAAEMSRDSGRSGHLFIGRLSRNTRVKDLEDVFETYGRIVRCDIKYGKFILHV